MTVSARSRIAGALALAVVIVPIGFAQLAAPSIATIQVVDGSGAVIPNARVALMPPVPNFPAALRADQNGSFTAELKPGSYRVSVASYGFLPLTKQIQVTSANAQTFPFVLSVNNAINGSSGPVVAVLNTDEHPAITLTVTAGGHGSKTLDLAALRALPHKSVAFHNVHTNADENYSGVLLIDLLASLGVPHGKDLHGKGLSEYVVVTGSDGYKAVLALAEIDPEFHPGDVIVADAMDGKPLDEKNGPFKLVVTEDKRPARSVHNLVSIEVKTAE